VTIDPTVVIAVIGTLSAAIGRAAFVIYRDLRKERDDWKDMALQLQGVNKTAVEVADKAAKRA
jgi:hypothetical protein